MLSQQVALKDTPFLFISDHDVEGFQIYLGLKYGSRSSAWASKIQTVPQLRWAGPSLADLTESSILFRPEWEAQYSSDHPEATIPELKDAADKWQKNRKIQLGSKLIAASQKDRQIIRGFKRYGYLENEPEVAAELELMLQRPGVSCIKLVFDTRLTVERNFVLLTCRLWVLHIYQFSCGKGLQPSDLMWEISVRKI